MNSRCRKHQGDRCRAKGAQGRSILAAELHAGCGDAEQEWRGSRLHRARGWAGSAGDVSLEPHTESTGSYPLPPRASCRRPTQRTPQRLDTRRAEQGTGLGSNPDVQEAEQGAGVQQTGRPPRRRSRWERLSLLLPRRLVDRASLLPPPLTLPIPVSL